MRDPSVEKKVRLDGWKAIADFLDVTERTAQKWEKEFKMPVYRLGPKMPVWTSKTELERWRQQSSAESAEERTARRRGRRIGVAMIAALLVAAAGLGVFSWTTKGACVPDTVRVDTGLLWSQSRAGQVCWKEPLPEGFVALRDEVGIVGRYLAHIQDLDGDGKLETLLIVSSRDRSEHGFLYCLEEDGGFRWRFPYGRPRTVRGRYFGGLYSGTFVTTVRCGEETLVLTAANHYPWYPCQLVLLREDGSLVAEYWHPGYIESFAVGDIDGDGTDEILLGGVNNPGDGLGHPAVALLKPPWKSRPEAFAPPNFFGASNQRELSYLLLPQPDVFRAERRGASVLHLTLNSSHLLAEVGLSDIATVYYELEVPTLELADARPSGHYIAWHDRLWRQGRLNHEFSAKDKEDLRAVSHLKTAPDGNSIEIQLLFRMKPMAAKRPDEK